jgi:hypothetical protein
VYPLSAGLVEILGFTHICLAYYGIVFNYCGVTIAAATVLLYLHTQVCSAVLMVISSYDKDPWQASACVRSDVRKG